MVCVGLLASLGVTKSHGPVCRRVSQQYASLVGPSQQALASQREIDALSLKHSRTSSYDCEVHHTPQLLL